MQQMRSDVARLLRIQGVDLGQAIGGTTGSGQGPGRPTERRRTKRQPEPIELHEPPTFIRFLWDEEGIITFYPEQRRYLRIVTDANSTYHNPNAPATSRINIIVGDQLVLRGSSPLRGGRMRAIVEGSNSSQPGHTGLLRVELTRPGLPVLVDERPFKIIATPESRPADRRVSLPPFKTVRVNGPDDPKWPQLGWPDNLGLIASEAQMEEGTLVIYYSTAFPKFAGQRQAFENRDTTLANSFVKRYEIWLAVHSLLHYQDQQIAASEQRSPEAVSDGNERVQEDPELAQERER